MTREDRVAVVVQPGAEGRQELRLAGDVTVFQATELHQAALGLAEQAADVDVRCDDVQSFDCATIQILMALQEALAARGKAFRVTGISAELQQTLASAGVPATFA
jgi:anti-anti-sigma factor